MNDFFRPQVLVQQHAAACGGVRRAHPPSKAVVSVFVVVAAVGVATWLCTGSWARKTRLDGVVTRDAGGVSRVELFATAADRATLRVDQPLRWRTTVAPSRAAGMVVPASGAIAALSTEPLSAPELRSLPRSMAARAAAEPLYRVTARLDDRPAQLGAGTAVRADVVVARRRLIEWLLEWRANDAAPA